MKKVEILKQIEQRIDELHLIAAIVCYDCEQVFDESNQEDKCVKCAELYDPKIDGESCPGCGSDEYDMLCPSCKGDNIEYLDDINWSNWQEDYAYLVVSPNTFIGTILKFLDKNKST